MQEESERKYVYCSLGSIGINRWVRWKLAGE